MEILIIICIINFIINLSVVGKFISEETTIKSFQPAWYDYIIFYGVLLVFGWLLILVLNAFDPYD